MLNRVNVNDRANDQLFLFLNGPLHVAYDGYRIGREAENDYERASALNDRLS